MGKVKRGLYYNSLKRGHVSIPYGKGKAIDERCEPIPSGVSIPYGKGKVKELYPYLANNNVSIPYGKGKEQHFVLCF